MSTISTSDLTVKEKAKRFDNIKSVIGNRETCSIAKIEKIIYKTEEKEFNLTKEQILKQVSSYDVGDFVVYTIINLARQKKEKQ